MKSASLSTYLVRQSYGKLRMPLPAFPKQTWSSAGPMPDWRADLSFGGARSAGQHIAELGVAIGV